MMKDEKGPDEKILCTPVNDPLWNHIGQLSDVPPHLLKEIEHFLKTNYIPLLGKIPFNTLIVEAMINRNTIVEYKPETDISNKIKMIWHTLSA